MSITKHGVKAPIPNADLYGVRGVYNGDTGMSGNLSTNECPVTASGTRFFITTEHEDVGLVTWLEASTLEEANHFLDRLKAVEEEEETP